MRSILGQILQDARYALRMMAKNSGFTAVAVITLALGIGANTAIFSFADALLFRPLPIKEPSELTTLFHVTKDGNWSSFSFLDYVELRDRNEVFSGLAAYADIQLELGVADQAELVQAAIVSGNYFSVLGVKPVLGRAFLAEEDRTAGTHPVAVISYSLWQRRFGADPDLPGKTVVLNGHPFTVVGIAPPGFRSTEVYSVPDIWVPLMMHREAMPSFKAFGTVLFGNRGTHWLSIVGRLRPDVSRQQVQAAVEVIARWQAESYLETNREWSILLVPANDARMGSPTGGSVVTLTKLLLAVTGLVLLIACANVANLFLAKSVSRRREMGIRLALGAGRPRILRQLITESLVLAMLGGAVGMLLAGWTSSLLSTFEVKTLLPGLDVQLDGRVLGFALLLSILTGALFGLVPAFQSSVVSVVQTLKEGSEAFLCGGRFPLRHALVALQVALSLILLVGAGLILKTVRNLQAVELGFDTEGLLLVPVGIGSHEYTEEEGKAFYQALLERVQALPGVESATLGFSAPFSGERMANDLFPESGERVNVDMNTVGLGYFRTMGIPLLRGRNFGEQDRAGSARVAIVNEAMATRLWPGEDPVGKQLRMYDPKGPAPVVEVVGVAANGRYYRNWRGKNRPFLFLPFSQMYMANMSLHIRSQDAAGPILQSVRQELKSLNPRLSIQNFHTAEVARDRAIVLERMGAKLLSVFGILALTLATVGIYGVVSFAVSQRTHEIGIRMALGASPLGIFRLVTLQSAQPILIGAVIGGAVALGLTQFMAHLLYGVNANDPATFAAATAGLVAVGFLATYLPARRATKVDPMVALRYE